MHAAEKKRDPLIALRIPPTLDTRLRAEAAALGVTLSEYVRVALEARLGPLPATPTATASRTQPRKRTGPAPCEHRVRPGNYCRRCSAIV